MAEPKDLPKAKGNTIVMVSAKTWNQLVDVVTAGWPLAGPGILISQLPDGRSIRTKGEAEGSDSSSSDSSDSESSSSSSSSDSESSSPSSGPPSGPGSSKDCVVRFGEGFIRWHCVERPDVVFEDAVTVELDPDGKGSLVLAAEMVESCEPGSLRVTAAITQQPAALGAWIDGTTLHVEAVAMGGVPETATVTIDGIRRGFAGRRWEPATEAEAIENARVWQLLNGQAVTL